MPGIPFDATPARREHGAGHFGIAMTETATSPVAAAVHDGHRMQCMEVWGGNRAVESSVVMAGLDAWVYSKPYGENASEGGDVYYVSSCATGRITRLLVADVAGHGDAVGKVGTQLRTLMRRYVNYIDQTRFVADLNHEFGQLSTAGCFATAVVTTFYGPTGSLSLCNAGHPPPLVYRADARAWSFLEATNSVAQCSPSESGNLSNIPLGILDLCDYEQFDVDLRFGDMVLCYTDCLPESKDRSGDLLGEQRLLEVVRSIDVSDPARVIPNLLAAIAALHPSNLTEDDVTCLLFRPNGTSVDVPLRDRMMAPLRVMRGVAGALVGKGPMPFPELTIANIGGAMLSPLGKLRRKGKGSQVVRREV
jgi:sigma-B regulation protein RsbU (phosphoserine phosphatase)